LSHLPIISQASSLAGWTVDVNLGWRNRSPACDVPLSDLASLLAFSSTFLFLPRKVGWSAPRYSNCQDIAIPVKVGFVRFWWTLTRSLAGDPARPEMRLPCQLQPQYRHI